MGDYARLRDEGVDLAPALLARAAEGSSWPGQGVALRPACQMCEYPAPPTLEAKSGQADAAHVNIGFIGVDGVLVEMDEETADRLGLRATPAGGEPWLEWPQMTAGDMAFRDDIVQRLAGEHRRRRDAVMAAFHAEVAGPAALARYFAACQRCHNCMVACPICYCKECLFRTGAIDRAPAGFLRLGRAQGCGAPAGGYRALPPDQAQPHVDVMRRLRLCESACPSDIPLDGVVPHGGRAARRRCSATFPAAGWMKRCR